MALKSMQDNSRVDIGFDIRISRQVKNTREMVDVSLSMSTIKRRLHESLLHCLLDHGSCKCFSRTSNIQEQEDYPLSENQDGTKRDLYQTDGTRKVWRRKGTIGTHSRPRHVPNMAEGL